jgi:hypothetical protein
MDKEEQRIASIIREKNKTGTGGKPEGIRRIVLTGDENNETALFEEQNALLKEKGLPHFVKHPVSLGGGIYIWYELTFDSQLFITSIDLSHRDPKHARHKDLSVDKTYELINHPKIPLELWIKRDKSKIKGISGIDFALTSVEENRLMDYSFTKLDDSLAEYDMPDMTMWIKKTDKLQAAAAQSTNAVISEVVKVEKLLKENPKDKALQQLAERLKERLVKAHETG